MTSLTLLYGSRARGDADAMSDEDVLSIGPQETDVAPTYTWEQLEAMHSYGSLFLHHLKLESQIVAGDLSGRREWEALKRTLPDYQRSLQDLRSFEVVARDIVDALSVGDSPLVYEASVAARLVRHLAIVACYESSRPNFKRYAAVAQAADHYGVALPTEVTYVDLYAALTQPNRAQVTVSGVLEWVRFTRALTKCVRQRIRKDGVSSGHP